MVALEMIDIHRDLTKLSYYHKAYQIRRTLVGNKITQM